MNKDLFGNKSAAQEWISGEDYAGLIVAETKFAVLFDDTKTQAWLPCSKIAIKPLSAPRRSLTTGRLETPALVTVPDWLAREKGLIEDPAKKLTEETHGARYQPIPERDA